jgi:branched-subunit amino acid aminotransferase/4-amino-4-deoxychorismate lyase
MLLTVVVTPVNKIVYGDKVFTIGEGSSSVGPVIKRLYDRVRGIQTGDLPDTFKWMLPVH